MTEVKQCNQMCEDLKIHRDNLVKLRDGTRNFTLLKKIDRSILQIDKARFAIERVTSDGNEKQKTIEAEALWGKAVDMAWDVDELVTKKRWKLGVLWFTIFAVTLTGIVATYIWLHLRFPSTDINSQFFWTDKGNAALSYAEVPFWACFGVLTWIVYNVQHDNRLGKDIRLRDQWYISKLCQAVPISMVIGLTLKGINLGDSVAGTAIPVIAGFILGYYSDRARDYLDVIRDKVIPGSSAPKVTLQPPQLTSGSQAYIRGNVEGPKGTEGTLTLGKAPPVPITLDDNGDFATLVEIADEPTIIRVEAKSSAKKVGSATRVVNVVHDTEKSESDAGAK